MQTRKIAPLPDEDDEVAFTPVTAEQARRLREEQPQVSPWSVVAGQIGVGLLAALACWAFTGRQNAGWSAAYGAMAVVVPAAVFVRGLGRHKGGSPTGAVARLFLWEVVKIGLSVALLAMAPRVVVGLSWPALLIGLVLAMKVYWVALLLAARNVKKRRVE